ncbi:hypothetical protein HY635_01985 [Candidatus Uhrbacteria bacterium]|nr:hypothetical protein [Candidatus Uhrbacteria bacterium]
MRVYKITGVFYPGMEWEDFFPEEHDGPKATIAVEPDRIPPGAEYHVDYDEDEWFNVAVRELTEQSARVALAAINHCRPKDVTFVCTG